MGGKRPRGWLAVLLLAAGCARGGGPETLTVATTWAEADRARLADAFHDRTGAALVWVPLDPNDDPTRRAGRVDAWLGGPLSSYQRLDGRRVARRSRVAVRWNREAAGGADRLTDPALAGRVAFDDPRRDPRALAWMADRLARRPWAEGYAELVRIASNTRRIGVEPGSATADLERGAAVAAPVESGNGSEADGAEYVEGVALNPASAGRPAARAFLELFPADSAPLPYSEANPLLADLLGATLVDAQDELWSARAALDRAGWPASAAGWMAEAPPWPPASITRLLQDGPDAELALETLADNLAVDAEQASALKRAWSRPPAPLDGAGLDALAAADGGRLAANPRVRAWLRAEWTAWARQRYRRIARKLGEATP